jgi:hypothetical protein
MQNRRSWFGSAVASVAVFLGLKLPEVKAEVKYRQSQEWEEVLESYQEATVHLTHLWCFNFATVMLCKNGIYILPMESIDIEEMTKILEGKIINGSIMTGKNERIGSVIQGKHAWFKDHCLEKVFLRNKNGQVSILLKKQV